jgi:hypothetical protein
VGNANMNCYEQDVSSLESRLKREKTVAIVGGILSLGLFRNKVNVQNVSSKLIKARESLSKFEDINRNIKELEKDSRVIILSGVRVSENTFADVPAAIAKDYGIDWDVLRLSILERDDYRCQESDGYCKGPLQVHHKLPLSQGGTNTSFNLITLCYYHHILKHPHMMER